MGLSVHHKGGWFQHRRGAFPAAATVGFVAAVLLAFVAVELPRAQRDTSRWVEHALGILARVATLEADVATVASEGRGFLVDRSAESADEFSAASLRAESDIAALRALVADNPVQLASLDRLGPLMAARAGLLREAMDRARAGGEDGAARLIESQRGRALMEQVAAEIEGFKAEEQRLLAARDAAALGAERWMTAGLVACAVTAAVSLCVAATLLAGRMRERTHLAALTRLNADLEARVAERTAELGASEARYRLLADSTGDVITRLDLDLTQTYASPACRAVLGYEPDEMLAAKLTAAVHPDDAEAVHRALRPLVAGEAERATVTYRVQHKLGHWIPVEAAIALVRDPVSDQPATLVCALRDATERNHLEASLRQAQRMEAVGQLTAGMAHDFNNLLQAILSAMDVLGEQTGLDEEGRDCLAAAEASAQRGAALVRRLLAFARKQPLAPTLLRPADVLSGVVALLGRTLGSRVRLETSAADEAWTVCADGTGLDDCLVNLALNARDAMPRGGVLQLRAENKGPEAARAMGLAPGDYVRFAVVDEGEGMAPEILARAMEPFFTTKPVGQGTGLGLPMVYGFARQSGGDVRIESAPGEGTAVSIWLPRAAERAAEGRGAVDGDGRKRVLVVDDEATVRWYMSLFLTKAGFIPSEAESAEAALELLRAGEQFDLIVTDQSMPGMSGCELVESALRLRPELPAMLVTGYDRVSGLDRLPSRVLVLRKPFERAAFLRQVQAILGAIALVVAGGLGAAC